MKKIKIFSMAIVMALLCLCTIQIAFAEAVTPEEYYYDETLKMTYALDSVNKTAATYIYGTYLVDSEAGTSTWTYNESPATEVAIPATITVNGEAYNVTKIGEYTFAAEKNKRGNSSATSNLITKTITLPEGITEIEQYAFFMCKTLKSLYIPSTVTTIGNGAFTNCQLMTGIDFADGIGITTIPDTCFKNCYRLGKLDLPQSVVSIQMNAFVNARALAEVKIHSDSVTLTPASDTYGFPAAMGATPPENTGETVKVPTVFYVKTESIKNRLIELAAENVVSSDKTYDVSGIKDGSQIKYFFDPITIDNIIYSQYDENGVEAVITGNTIAKNSNLAVVIPSKITVNGREITVKTVGEQAFCYLDEAGDPSTDGKTIVSLVLPETVTSISKKAFYCLNYMESFAAKGDIVLNETTDTEIFSICTQLTEIDFKTINMLTKDMFDYCRRLKKVVIPSGATITIDKQAFDRATDLTDVYLNASEVTFIGNDDKGTMKNAIMNFHVPTESAKTALTTYGVANANVIVGEKLYLMDNLLGTYAIASEAISEGKIIIATYKDGMLVDIDDIKDVDFSIGYNKIETDLEGTERRIFVWSSFENIFPIGKMIK